MPDPRPPTRVRTTRPLWARLTAAILLAGPFAALLWVGGYARSEPSLFGFPFFYWYQLSWVFVSSCTTWCAYLALAPARSRRDGARQSRGSR